MAGRRRIKAKPKPRVFPRFAQLPPELRLLVWEAVDMGPANVHLISSANKRVHRVSICALYRVCRESRYVAQRREILELRIGKKTICPALANPDDVFVITRLPAAPRRFVYSAVMDICISRGLLKKDRHTHRIGPWDITIYTPKCKAIDGCHREGFDVEAAYKAAMPVIRRGELFKLVPELACTLAPIIIFQARPRLPEGDEPESDEWNSLQERYKVVRLSKKQRQERMRRGKQDDEKCKGKQAENNDKDKQVEKKGKAKQDENTWFLYPLTAMPLLAAIRKPA